MKKTKEKIIDWLAEHNTAYEDFCRAFHLKDDNEVSKCSLNNLIGWISDHEYLTLDFISFYFDISPEGCEDLSKEQICELLDSIEE